MKSGSFSFISWKSESKTAIEAPNTEGKNVQPGEVYVHRYASTTVTDITMTQAWLYVDNQWKNITDYWNDIRGMEPILHPFENSPVRYLIYRSDGTPSWVQHSRYTAFTRQTVKDADARADSRAGGKSKATRGTKARVTEAEIDEDVDEEDMEDH